LRFVAGEPISVQAAQLLGGAGVDKAMTGTLEFAHGVLGAFDCSFEAPNQRELELVGSQGVLRSLDPWCARTPLVLERDGTREEIAVASPDIYACQWDGFARAVAGERMEALDRSDTLGQARTLDALLRAAATGTTAQVAR
jgi:predicted dehydrogenase